MKLRIYPSLCVLLMAAGLIPTSRTLPAQVSESVLITLQVSDQTGAVIPHALVVINSSPTPPDFVQSVANESGIVKVALTPGIYYVSVSSPGFRILRRQIKVQAATTIPVALQVGSGGGPSVRAFDLILTPAYAQVREGIAVGERAPNSTELKVTIDANHSRMWTLDMLKPLQHKTVTLHNPHTNADETYSGVLLIDLLSELGTPHGKDLHGKALLDYVIATGSDGYKVVLALAEVDPEFHPGEVLVADQMGGKPLDAKSGPFRLVVTEDKRPARSVHSLVSIEVKTAE